MESRSTALETEIDKTLKPQSFAVDGLVGQGADRDRRPRDSGQERRRLPRGVGPLANETVVIGAHYDHLGRGEKGTKDLGSTAIHYGADDNASGTTALMELARRFARARTATGRRIVFVAFYRARRRGLFGSLHYCDKPPFPLKDTVAMLNMDMVGRVRPDEKTKKDRIVDRRRRHGQGRSRS